MRATEACGCKHDGQHWLSKCERCAALDRAVSARWAAEHIANSPGTAFTDDYLLLAAEHDPSVIETAWLNTAGAP